MVRQDSFRKSTFDISAVVADLNLKRELQEDGEDTATLGTSTTTAVAAEDEEEEATKDASAVVENEEAKEPERKVSFSEVTIREYPIIVGDNPSVTKGCPITIDWVHVASNTLEFEKYETLRDSQYLAEQKESGKTELPSAEGEKDAKQRSPKLRREMKEMRMLSTHRDQILKSLGFSLQERQAGTKRANVAKQQRKATIDGLGSSKIHYRMEKLSKGVKNAFSFGKRKQREKQYLQKHYYDNKGLALDASTATISSAPGAIAPPVSAVVAVGGA